MAVAAAAAVVAMAAAAAAASDGDAAAAFRCSGSSNGERSGEDFGPPIKRRIAIGTARQVH